MMKKLSGTLNATPSKRLYLSIISDYGLKRAICELIDNALDVWVIAGRKNSVNIEVSLSEDQQVICVTDDAGGVKRSELQNIVAPGQTGTKPSDATIGLFGVGTKRAVVALSQDVKITTRHGHDKSYRVEIDDEWLKEDDWNLPVYEVSPIDPGSTRIDLNRLRLKITKDSIEELREHAAATYAEFLKDDRVKIVINKKPVGPTTFENWAYPPSYQPRRYTGELNTQDGKKVAVEVVAGLTTESSPTGGDYGVFFYCNERLIARGMKSHDVGFSPGLAGLPHPKVSLARVLVRLKGDARLMPWNSSKSAINTHHEVFLALQAWLIRVVKDYAYVSRTWVGEWPDKVFKYKKGDIVDVPIENIPEARKSFLPPLPRAVLRYADIVEHANRKVSSRKPWTRGLYEGVVAAEMVFKKNWEQKNRIALIILDSTLEIGFKEYLVNDSGEAYSDKRLLDLFKDRTAVHGEIKKHASISKTDWGKIEHYYRLRCKLIHERVTVGVTDSQIEDYRSVVEAVLKKLHKLTFSGSSPSED
ncbi:MAG: ATP-binding protein [Elusimicrobia bacterium]|nr:ATP-binding protein [Elusimicrobiota bacterium]